MTEQSLKEKTVNGTIWSAADTFIGQGVTFIVGLVLARLLSPEEYGLIGIVTIFTTVMYGVVDSGFSNALIRKTDVGDDEYSTLFYFNLIVSVLMFTLLFCGAPLIANFFERPQLINLCRVTGLLLIFQAFSIVQNTILSRRIDFKTKTKASLISAIISGLLGIVMAFIGFGVWSLVAQILSRQLLYTVCLWIFNRWWPKLQFNFQSLRYMWGFGWKLLVSGLLDNLWKELYQVIIGKFYNPAMLGQYTRSSQYAGIFSNNLTSVIQRVSYPVLATVREDKTRLVQSFRRVIKITMFATSVIMIPMGAIADPLIFCLIGPQWHIAATFLPLICLNMSLYPLHALNLIMLEVHGRTDVFLFLEVVKKIIAVGPILLGVFVNIYWMLIGSIAAGVISFFLNSYYAGKSLGYSSKMQLFDVIPSYLIAFLIAVPIFFLKYLPLSYWIVLPIQIIVGSTVFFLICEKMDLPEYIEVKGIAKMYIRKFMRK